MMSQGAGMDDPGRSPDDRARLTASADANPAEIEDLRAQLDAVQHECDQYQLLLRQTRADFGRYRRQVEAERAEHAKVARVELLVRVLPILDDFQAVVAQSGRDEQVTGLNEDIERIQRS